MYDLAITCNEHWMNDEETKFLLAVPDHTMSEEEYREWIMWMQRDLESDPDAKGMRELDTIGFHTEHTVTPGMYMRELTMPAGAIVVSQIHLHEHPFIVVKGEVSVYDGKELVRIKAPYKGITKPGTKRVLYIHEETTWITFHATEETDLDMLESDGVLVVSTYDQLDEYTQKEALCLSE